LDYYPWLLSAHIIAWTAWMAGMLYLPRLFVYHAEVGPRTPQSETFKVMERRLLKAILNPAMIAVWITGLWLAIASGYIKTAGWLHVKLVLVLLMSGMHGFLAASARRFAGDANSRSARFYRICNEVPTVLLVAIVILAVVKPF
jgi:protoporphyrinogen IX oxidase